MLIMYPFMTMGQEQSVDKVLSEIDSLVHYHRLAIAQQKTDSLYELLYTFNSSEKHKPELLEVRYRQALILDRQEASPAKVLRMLLEIKDEAEAARLHELTYHTLLLIALAYEKAGNLELTDQYLNLAFVLYKQHSLENLYSTYCIRKASFHRLENELDSTWHYANQAKVYAEKYNNETDLKDAYMVLGSSFYQQGNYDNALLHALLLLSSYRKTGNTEGMSIAHYSIAQTDSAFFYFKQYHDDLKVLQDEEEKVKTKELEELYQNDKKAAIIKTKDQQMALIGFLLSVIAIATVALIKKNRQINKQNKIISKQLDELKKTLDQKQILLSELQHRVKNNLQHVISILEIQKESAHFNNIDELIRGNQNRIHSMALLHKKLNVSDNVNDVDIGRYVTELSELVKDSYDNHTKTIALDVTCEIETMSIEKALPLGLIIVELVSNSMKHAFRKRSVGIIAIKITKDGVSNRLHYADNGEGFDFNQTSEKGLGQEIIKGLVDQLGGNTETNDKNGFELTVSFA